MNDGQARRPDPARPAPAVSVAIGTHNGAAYLEPQLRSILGQSVPVDEVVLSDDASTDGTPELAESILDEHRRAGGGTRLRVIRNARALGVTANFEQALAATSGGVIALSDQDDVWRADRIAVALAVLDERPGLELVVSDARLVDAEGVPLDRSLFDILGVDLRARERLASGPALDELLRRNLLTGATMLLRRSLLDRARPFPDSWVHDEWLAMAAALGGGIGVVEAPLIDYRQHGANQIGVEALSFRGRLGRLAAPRSERNARLLARAADLAERAPGLRTAGGPDAARVESAVRAKLAHERRRSALPRARLARLPEVLALWRTGGYRRYGLGAQDALRDLVQPPS